LAHSPPVVVEGALGGAAAGEAASTTGADAGGTLLATRADSLASPGEAVITTELAEGTTLATGRTDDPLVGLAACMWRKPKNPAATRAPARPRSAGAIRERALLAGADAALVGTGWSIPA